VLSNASRPAKPSFDATGTPITGQIVRDANAPARCADIPAAAITTLIPSADAVAANSAATSGVRCAEITRTTGLIPNRPNISMQLSITGQSLSEPITTATDLLFSGAICLF